MNDQIWRTRVAGNSCACITWSTGWVKISWGKCTQHRQPRTATDHIHEGKLCWSYHRHCGSTERQRKIWMVCMLDWTSLALPQLLENSSDKHWLTRRGIVTSVSCKSTRRLNGYGMEWVGEICIYLYIKTGAHFHWSLHTSASNWLSKYCL